MLLTGNVCILNHRLVPGDSSYFLTLTRNPYENEQPVSVQYLLSIAWQKMWFLNHVVCINPFHAAQVYGPGEMISEVHKELSSLSAEWWKQVLHISIYIFVFIYISYCPHI